PCLRELDHRLPGPRAEGYWLRLLGPSLRLRGRFDDPLYCDGGRHTALPSPAPNFLNDGDRFRFHQSETSARFSRLDYLLSVVEPYLAVAAEGLNEYRVEVGNLNVAHQVAPRDTDPFRHSGLIALVVAVTRLT